jgi:flagellar biosynthesis component FlhA
MRKTFYRAEKRKKRGNSVYTIGMPLLFVTFIAVCLIILMAIAMVTARTDMNSSRHHAERRLAYIEAVNEAEEECSKASPGDVITVRMDTGGKVRAVAGRKDGHTVMVECRVVREKWSGSDEDSVSGFTGISTGD